MKNKKIYLLFILVLSMCLGLAACGSNNGDNQDNGGGTIK